MVTPAGGSFSSSAHCPRFWRCVIRGCPAGAGTVAGGKTQRALKQAALRNGSAQSGDLFSNPVWRKHFFVGVALGLAGMAGLWGIGFFSPELISTALKGQPQNVVDNVRGQATALQDVGAFCGMLAFTFVATYAGRTQSVCRRVHPVPRQRPFLCSTTSHPPAMPTGCCPSWALRSCPCSAAIRFISPNSSPRGCAGTGISFCYNTVRYLAAAFPLMLGKLNELFLAHGVNEPFRKVRHRSFLHLPARPRRPDLGAGNQRQAASRRLIDSPLP